VENPLNTRGKNHGRQPARTSLYRESGYNANGGGLQEENESISNGKGKIANIIPELSLSGQFGP
jgi:hypothetical protein